MKERIDSKWVGFCNAGNPDVWAGAFEREKKKGRLSGRRPAPLVRYLLHSVNMCTVFLNEKLFEKLASSIEAKFGDQVKERCGYLPDNLPLHSKTKNKTPTHHMKLHIIF